MAALAEATRHSDIRLPAANPAEAGVSGSALVGQFDPSGKNTTTGVFVAASVR